jgi:hypothetical protein
VDVSSIPSKGVNSYEMLLQNIQLIIAKAVIAISEQNQIGNESDSDFVKAFCMGLDFGTPNNHLLAGKSLGSEEYIYLAAILLGVNLLHKLLLIFHDL